MNTNEMFQPEDVISTYTDHEAIEDGVLVPISTRDRVTRSVWEWLVAKAPKGSKPPNCWPVDMMGWFRAGDVSPTKAAKLIAKHGLEAQKKFELQVMYNKALAMSKGLIGTHRDQAQRTYDENFDGGIYKLYGWVDTAGVLFQLGTEPNGVFCTFWLLPNENQGITLMFPEDY